MLSSLGTPNATGVSGLRGWVGLRENQAISLAQKQAGDHSISLLVKEGNSGEAGAN